MLYDIEWVSSVSFYRVCSFRCICMHACMCVSKFCRISHQEMSWDSTHYTLAVIASTTCELSLLSLMMLMAIMASAVV